MKLLNLPEARSLHISPSCNKFNHLFHANVLSFIALLLQLEVIVNNYQSLRKYGLPNAAGRAAPNLRLILFEEIIINITMVTINGIIR